MKFKVRDAFLFYICGLALLCAAWAQTSKGSITGTVTDPQGADVSGSQVKATDSDTGIPFTTTTDSSGVFRFNLIAAGGDRVEISASGFNAVQNSVTVVAGSDNSVGTLKLAVGQATTTVEVNAEAPLIEPTSSQVTNTITGTALHTFAGIQENEGLDNLALFVPGVVASRDLSFSNTNGVTGFIFNGIRGPTTHTQIYHLNHNDNPIST